MNRRLSQTLIFSLGALLLGFVVSCGSDTALVENLTGEARFPGGCGDGADNDIDGLFDCADPDCEDAEECPPDGGDLNPPEPGDDDDDDSASSGAGGDDDDDDSSAGDDDDSGEAGDDDTGEDLPPCTSDPFEPNDHEGAAHWFANFGFVEGGIACPNDDDWFGVYMEPWDQLEVSIFFPTDEGLLMLDLYDPQGQIVASGLGGPGAADQYFSFTATETGPHHFVVSMPEDAGEPESTYSMSVGYTPATCLADLFEPNQTRTGAASQFPHPWWNMMVCPNDVDWYETTMEAGEYLEVWAFFDHDEGDINLALYDRFGVLLTESNGTGDEEYIAWELDPDVPYQFRLTNDDDTGDYYGNMYDLLQTQTYVGSGCAIDALEFNDGQDWAYPATNGLVTGLSACDTDTDWFKLQAIAGDPLELTVEWEPSEGIPTVALVDDVGTPVGTQAVATSVLTHTYTAALTTAYFFSIDLGVDAGSTPGLPYSFEVEGLTPQCMPDVWEPNDHEGLANGLGLDPYTDLWLCADEDWYERFVPSGLSLEIAVSYDPSEGEIEMNLYNPTGLILDSSVGGAGFEEVSMTSNEGTYYTVQMIALSDTGDPGIPYEMQATVY